MERCPWHIAEWKIKQVLEQYVQYDSIYIRSCTYFSYIPGEMFKNAHPDINWLSPDGGFQMMVAIYLISLNIYNKYVLIISKAKLL
jgi:hypothetical protein